MGESAQSGSVEGTSAKELETAYARVVAKTNPRVAFQFGPDFALHGLDNERAQLHTLLENTFRLREGKSCMVIGPRGSGKTTLVNWALSDLATRYDFFTIRLDGQVHSDDKTAIREMARQLDGYLSQYAQDTRRRRLRATFEQSSINATMNVIVNILDKTRLNETEETVVDAGGFPIRQRKQLMPVVVIVENVHVYATHAKQTLLYNLFDMAQARGKAEGKGTCVAVVGLTTRTTVREQLEKRVKSRFSQRIIQINKPRTLDAFVECVFAMLGLAETGDKVACAHNARLRNLLEGLARKTLVRNFHTVRDLNCARNELLVMLDPRQERESKALEAGSATSVTSTYSPLPDYAPKTLTLLDTLSMLELRLLICCSRVKSKTSLPALTFDVVAQEYLTLHDAARSEIQSRLQTVGASLKQHQYERSAHALKTAWERLLSLHLLHPHTPHPLSRLVEVALEADEMAPILKSRDPKLVSLLKL